MLLVFAWALSSLVHMCTVHDFRSTQTSTHNTCTVTVEIWMMNVRTMPLHWGPLALPLTLMLPPVGFILTLTLPCVLIALTTSLRSWNDYNAFERMLRRIDKIGVGILFTIGFIVFIVHLTRISGRFVYSCSQPFLSGLLLFPRSSVGQPFFIHALHTTRGIFFWNCFFLE